MIQNAQTRSVGFSFFRSICAEGDRVLHDQREGKEGATRKIRLRGSSCRGIEGESLGFHIWRWFVFCYVMFCYDMLCYVVMCDYMRFYDTIRSLMLLYLLLCYAVSFYVMI